ncbi:conserved hypothetical protein [Ricinus communis]|uniref:Uncharacterized protein n=1 Tax=Ricinus communis TaxID=3988 RepID=B9T9N3_RICCO|nr:conserved hypothetical protein [Ricinus communis]EEF27429.1 conserved hypothetical protein [Ricinus communis]
MSAQVDGSLCSVKVGTERVFPKDRNYAIQSIFSFRGKARAAIAIQGVESEPVEQRTKSNSKSYANALIPSPKPKEDKSGGKSFIL